MEKVKVATRFSNVVAGLVIVLLLVTVSFWNKPVSFFDGLVRDEQTCMIKSFGRKQFMYIHNRAAKLYHEAVVESGRYRAVSAWFRPTEKELQSPDAVKRHFTWYKGWELILDTSMRLLYILLLRWEVFVISLLVAAIALVVSLFRGYMMRRIVNSNRNYPDYPPHKWTLRLKPWLKWLLLVWFFMPPFPYYYLGFLIILLGMCYSAGVSMAYLYKKQ